MIAPDDPDTHAGHGVTLHPRSIGELAHSAESLRLVILHPPASSREGETTTTVLVSLKRKTNAVATRIVSAFAAFWRDDDGSASPSWVAAAAGDAAGVGPAYCAGGNDAAAEQSGRKKKAPGHFSAALGTSSGKRDGSGASDAGASLSSAGEFTSAEAEAVIALSRVLAVAAHSKDVRGSMTQSAYKHLRLLEVRARAGGGGGGGGGGGRPGAGGGGRGGGCVRSRAPVGCCVRARE